MTSPYLTRVDSWCVALRDLMGYAAGTPFHTLSWCASSPRNALQALRLVQIAADLGTDLVHVAMSLDQEEPLGVALAVRENMGMRWLPDARLYAASEAARIELLVGGRRWHVGPRQFLTSAKLPPRARREKGEEIAWRRWRQAAASMPTPQLNGSLFVPAGAQLADAIPREQLKVAA